jgi:hypothetical protein
MAGSDLTANLPSEGYVKEPAVELGAYKISHDRFKSERASRLNCELANLNRVSHDQASKALTGRERARA